MQRLNADEEHSSSEESHSGRTAEEFYDHYAPILLTYLYSRVSSWQDAEDLLLEVFVAAFNNEKLFQLNDEQQLAWLRRVARNKVIDQYRHAAVLSLLPLEQVLETSDDELTPERHAMQREQYEHLYRSIEQLSALERQLIRLRYGNGLRLVEIADMLEKPDGTVRKLLARTLRKLRTDYERQEKGGRL